MILCCGEALIDMIPERTAGGAEGFVPLSGGAVFNTAVALGRLGTKTGMLTGLSDDMFGVQLRSALGAAGVDTSGVIVSSRPSTLAFVRLQNGHASYVFYDENSAGRMLSADDMPPIPAEVTALYFGGISLACEPGADAYAALLDQEGAGRAVMIDPNIRPGFIKDEARYRGRIDRMIAKADIVKVSDEDLNWIIKGSATLDEKARTLLNNGPSMLVLTRGKDGATAYLAAGSSVHVLAMQVKVVDTVGAGDTYNAGVLAVLQREGVLTKDGLKTLSPAIAERALEFGAKVAAVTVSRAGANPPWAHEL
jgi:fructokinase